MRASHKVTDSNAEISPRFRDGEHGVVIGPAAGRVRGADPAFFQFWLAIGDTNRISFRRLLTELLGARDCISRFSQGRSPTGAMAGVETP